MGIFTNSTRLRSYCEDADVDLPLPTEAIDNHEEVEDAHTGEIDPDPIVDTVEESFFIASECERNFGKLMMAVGIRELQICKESGVDYIHEAPDIKGFFNKVKEFFRTLIKKIWSVVKNFIVAIQSRFMKTDAFVKKYQSQIKSGFDKIDSSNFKLKGYKFTNMDYSITKEFSDADSTCKELEDLTNKAIESNNSEEVVSRDFTNEELSNMEDRARGSMIASNKSISASNYSEELFKFFHGGELEKDDLNKSDINITKVLDVMRGGKKDIEKAKKNYKDIEKKFNDIIKNLTKIETKLASKSSKSDSNLGPAWSVITKYVTFSKSISNIVHQANAAHLQAMKHQLSQARRICMMCVQRTNKVDKKLLGESYSGYGSTINDVQFI